MTYIEGGPAYGGSPRGGAPWAGYYSILDVGLSSVAANGAVALFTTSITIPALTGVATSAGVASLAPSPTPALMGVSATCRVAGVSDAVAKPLTGVAATGVVAQAELIPVRTLRPVAANANVAPLVLVETKTLTGIAANGVVAQVTPHTATNPSLVGVVALGHIASFIPAEQRALTPVAANANVAQLAPQPGPRLTGVAATGVVLPFVRGDFVKPLTPFVALGVVAEIIPGAPLTGVSAYGAVASFRVIYTGGAAYIVSAMPRRRTVQWPCVDYSVAAPARARISQWGT